MIIIQIYTLQKRKPSGSKNVDIMESGKFYMETKLRYVNEIIRVARRVKNIILFILMHCAAFRKLHGER